MADVHTTEQRSRNMAAIRSRDTKPEMIVRRLVHSMGYRYRLHRRDLPGTPDLVFPRLKRVVDVRGCYWHMHTCRWGSVVPATNPRFWKEKRSASVARDARNLRRLRRQGWRVLIVWECETREPDRLARRIGEFLLAEMKSQASPTTKAHIQGAVTDPACIKGLKS